MTEQQGATWTETIRVEGGQLLGKVRELIHEGNVRQITIRQGDRMIVSLPVTLGVVTAVIAPALAAIGAAAALLTGCTIEVEHYGSGTGETPGEAPAEGEEHPGDMS
jgi:acyl-CoA reductase-like NAD-dependent aldehyde dehydrogenase